MPHSPKAKCWTTETTERKNTIADVEEEEANSLTKEMQLKVSTILSKCDKSAK